jgi:hypothetical protein
LAGVSGDLATRNEVELNLRNTEVVSYDITKQKHVLFLDIARKAHVIRNPSLAKELLDDGFTDTDYFSVPLFNFWVAYLCSGPQSSDQQNLTKICGPGTDDIEITTYNDNGAEQLHTFNPLNAAYIEYSDFPEAANLESWQTVTDADKRPRFLASTYRPKVADARQVGVPTSRVSSIMREKATLDWYLDQQGFEQFKEAA